MMEKLYRVFTWGILAAVYLLVMPFLFVALSSFPDPCKWPVLVLVYGVLLFWGWKKVIVKDVIAEPPRPSRPQSALIWATVLLFLFAASRIVFFKFAECNYCFSVRTDYLLFPCFAVGAVSAVFLVPFKKHAKGFIFGLAGTGTGLVIVLVSGAFNLTNFSYSGEKLPVGYVMNSKARKRFFPDGASRFRIEGESGFLTWHVEWSCKVPQREFDVFRKENAYNFVLDRHDVNEDPEIPPVFHDDRTWEKPYYFYNRRHADGGGLTMRYSVPSQTLYGKFSNR